MTSVIYKIRNIINDKQYIGSSANFHNRKAKHLSDLRRGNHHSIILQRAYNKYGKKAFIFEIIEQVNDENSLCVREQYYLDTFTPEYNVGKFANEKTRLGLKSSPEHCAKMSMSLKGRNSPSKGKKFSEEHKKKISEANKGKKNALGHRHSDATKEKIRQHHNARSNPNKSLEWKEKHSEIMKKVYANLGEEKKRNMKSQVQRTPDKITHCVICNNEITYRPKGSDIPKTCSTICRANLGRKHLNERRQLNPNMDKEAARKRWKLQPIYLGERDDVDPSECTESQLHYKVD